MLIEPKSEYTAEKVAYFSVNYILLVSFCHFLSEEHLRIKHNGKESDKLFYQWTCIIIPRSGMVNTI